MRLALEIVIETRVIHVVAHSGDDHAEQFQRSKRLRGAAAGQEVEQRLRHIERVEEAVERYRSVSTRAGVDESVMKVMIRKCPLNNVSC